MPTTKKLSLFNLGVLGVNQVESPLHLADGELLNGQNAEIYRETGELAVRKRLGIGAFVGDALAGPVHQLCTVPLVDPSPPSGGGDGPTGVWFVLTNSNDDSVAEVLEYTTAGGWQLRVDLGEWSEADASGGSTENGQCSDHPWFDGIVYQRAIYGIVARDVTGAALATYTLPGADNSNRTFGGHTGQWYLYGLGMHAGIIYGAWWTTDANGFYIGVTALDPISGVLSEASALTTLTVPPSKLSPVNNVTLFDGVLYFGAQSGWYPAEQIGPWVYDLSPGGTMTASIIEARGTLAAMNYAGFGVAGDEFYLGWSFGSQEDGDAHLYKRSVAGTWSTVRSVAWDEFVTWVYQLLPIWTDGDDALIAQATVTDTTVTFTILYSANGGSSWTSLTTFDLDFFVVWGDFHQWFRGMLWNDKVRFAGPGAHGAVSAYSYDPVAHVLTDDLQLDATHTSLYHLGAMYRP